MLQIITGKFFRDVKLYETLKRGVLYSNYAPLMQQSFETVCGTIHGGERWRDVSTLIYEITERLEATRPDGTNEFLVATNHDSIVQDFSAVISFAMNITCSPDIELVRRLTQDRHPSLGVAKIPAHYVRRIFDEKIESALGDRETLQDFFSALVGLRRADYETGWLKN